MKTITYRRYGDPEVLEMVEVDKPVPAEDEILIKVYATSVTSGDIRLRKADPFLARFMVGLFNPKKMVLGLDVGGEVEAIGTNVTRFKVGDKVFGSTGGLTTGYTEYTCLPEKAVLTVKPDSISYEESAAIFFGGHTANHFLKKADLQEGQSILIIGASGALGTNAVQLAKLIGAKVTGICSSKNIELVKSLGADEVIDYTKDDFTIQDEKYDVIFDTIGKSPYKASIKKLNTDGVYLDAVNISISRLLISAWINLTTKKKIVGGVAHEFLEDLEYLKGMVVEGKLKPVIDKIFLLEEIVEAHRHVESGHKAGNVVITVQ